MTLRKKIAATLALAIAANEMILHIASTKNADEKTIDAKTVGGTAKLLFKGIVEVASNSLPSLPRQKMASFFRSKELRNLLVMAGGKRPCNELPVTGDILKQWKEACEVLGAQSPDESDSVLSVTKGGIEFLGLTLVSKENIGAKLIREPSPRYEFVLIWDEQTAIGLQ